MRLLAFLWLGIVLFLSSYLGHRTYDGIHFRTDLMALLPREEQDPTLQRGTDAVTAALSQRMILLVGSKDRQNARNAATHIAEELSHSDQLESVTANYSSDLRKEMGRFYYPYRFGLLASNDHAMLSNGKASAIATRALSEAYGLMGISDAIFLQNDPFLLFMNFMATLPMPVSNVSMDDGMLTTTDKAMTWILITAHVKGMPYALSVQDDIMQHYNKAVLLYPDVQILHSGAVFFAAAGAKTAMHETNVLGVISLAGTVLLLILFFRTSFPILLTMLTLLTGMMVALSACLWIFGELHVSTLLFGISLIGIATDYGLQYCSEIFSSIEGTPHERLKRVLPAITLGMITTVIGYVIFFLAPFPGLRQVAAFSTIGLLAAWTTLVLWLPGLDRMKPPRHGTAMLALSARYLALWAEPRYATARKLLLCTLFMIALIGLFRMHMDDDVRHLQALSSQLKQEQNEIQRLVGYVSHNEFFLVEAEDDETALQREEILAGRLEQLVKQHELTSFQGLTHYIPSIKRQHENQKLVEETLTKPLLAKQLQQLHLTGKARALDREKQPVLSLANTFPPAFEAMIRLHKVGASMHMVSLYGIQNADHVREAAHDIPGIRFISPVEDYTKLIGKYRYRAYALLLLSAVLMAPLVIWRYGFRPSFFVVVPPILAVILTPCLRALAGGSFTFFDAMALVLVLSVGVDYTIFCAETSGKRRAVTMLAVTQNVSTTLMSFGLLAFSSVTAIQSFGLTMLVGITLAYILAPMACRGEG